MYLQITTKCNMKCSHCCYSCNMWGKHADFNTVVDSIAFAREWNNETISIGGGEPTIHPRFFDILKICLQDFDYVWMATNGSQTDSMYRLDNILNQCDYPECDCETELGEEDYEKYGCLCHEKMDLDSIYQKDKLSVALSLDCFHEPINENIEKLWRNQANIHRYSHFEIRDVSHSVIAEGRAKKTGSGWEEGCVCSDIIIKPDGKLKLCGCNKSPIIGDVWSGFSSEYENIFENEKYNDERCYKAL